MRRLADVLMEKLSRSVPKVSRRSKLKENKNSNSLLVYYDITVIHKRK